MKYKSKIGFTFVELLVVIAIIGIFALVMIPAINLIKTKIDKRLYETKIDMLTSAAEMYAQDNVFSDEKIEITVQELLEKEYLEADEKGTILCESENSSGCILDPTNDELLNGKYICIKKKGLTYTASWGKCEEANEE